MDVEGWFFPMGAGVFSQARWWFVHGCAWRARHGQGAPRWCQSRLGALMSSERRA